MIWIVVTKPPAGGVSIRRLGGPTEGGGGQIVQVRLPRIAPVIAGGLGGGLVCFVSVFIARFLMGMAPPLWFGQVVWVTALVVAVGVYAWRSLVIGSGMNLRSVVVVASRKNDWLVNSFSSCTFRGPRSSLSN